MRDWDSWWVDLLAHGRVGVKACGRRSVYARALLGVWVFGRAEAWVFRAVFVDADAHKKPGWAFSRFVGRLGV